MRDAKKSFPYKKNNNFYVATVKIAVKNINKKEKIEFLILLSWNRVARSLTTIGLQSKPIQKEGVLK